MDNKIEDFLRNFPIEIDEYTCLNEKNSAREQKLFVKDFPFFLTSSLN